MFAPGTAKDVVEGFLDIDMSCFGSIRLLSHGISKRKKFCETAESMGMELVNLPSAANVLVATRGQLAFGAATFVELSQ